MLCYFRIVHQVTYLALHMLKKEAFSTCANDTTMATWEDQRKTRSPTFLFWGRILKYETLVLLLVGAHRHRYFTLYVEALEELILLFFALDYVNYARWAPIHLRDMKSLSESIFKVFQEKERWVLSKTGNRFSAIPFDQAHEQENKVVKSAGEAVGLTENPVAFR